jgi:hypothetical protein
VPVELLPPTTLVGFNDTDETVGPESHSGSRWSWQTRSHRRTGRSLHGCKRY